MVEAGSIRTAKAALADHDFDCAVVDYMLPDGDVLGFLRHLRAAGRSLPVVVVTGYGHDGRARTVLAAGAGDYLEKDDLPDRNLVRAVRNAIERHSAVARLLEARSRLELLSRTDPLTGLLNRRGLAGRLGEERVRVRRTGVALSAMLVDIDELKQVNDTQGYAVGDALLRAVAESLRVELREVDAIARLGGDEFLVVLPDTELEGGFAVAERCRGRIASITLEGLGDGAGEVSASFGLAQMGPGDARLDAILRQLHPALRASKSRGGGTITVATRAPADSTSPDALSAAAMPIGALEDHRTVAFEVLVRGQLEGIQLPDGLHHVGVEAARLTRVDLRCLNACVQSARGRAPHLVHHVNMLPSTLVRTPAEQIVAALGDGAWCVEVNATLLDADLAGVCSSLEVLREAGVRVAVDEVGGGRVSLEALATLRPDVVKIDRRYLAGAVHDHGRRRVLDTVLALAQAAGAKPVAVGIENESDLHLARAVGIGLGQGWYWGRPRPLEAG